MAVVRIKTEVDRKINLGTFICSLTDQVADYPTSADCSAGSEMYVKDDTTNQITDILIFDGTNWNIL